jgi:hypothetical protein
MVYKQNLTKELYFYLIQHNFLHLPGLGDCILKRIPASIDSETRVLLPPSYAIHFTPSETGTHRELFSYLAEKLNTTEVDAIMMVNDFAMELKYLLQRDGIAPIEFIGKLLYNDFGKLSLEAQPLNLNFLSQSVPDTVNVENIKTASTIEEKNNEDQINNNESEIHLEVVIAKSSWKKKLLILTSITITIFIMSRIFANPNPLMGLQTPIQVKLPLIQHN